MITDIEKILRENDNNEDSFYDISDMIMEKEIEEGFSKLTEGEKVIFAINKLISEVNNGGFDQFFSNTNGEYNELVMDSLEQIKQSKLSKLFQRAIEAYESDMDEDDRLDELDDLDTEFHFLDDDFYNNLYNVVTNYIKNNLDEF